MMHVIKNQFKSKTIRANERVVWNSQEKDISVKFRVVFDPNAIPMLQKDLSTFQCAKDGDVKRFLKTMAIDFERRNLSRTFLVIDADSSVEDNLTILAYFSLAISYMNVGSEVPRAIRGRLNYRAKKPTVPCYLIGQMAKNDAFRDRISGSEILDIATGYLVEAQEKVAGCCVRVDCKKNEKLMKFYQTNGFQFLQMNESGNLCQLFKFILPPTSIVDP